MHLMLGRCYGEVVARWRGGSCFRGKGDRVTGGGPAQPPTHRSHWKGCPTLLSKTALDGDDHACCNKVAPTHTGNASPTTMTGMSVATHKGGLDQRRCPLGWANRLRLRRGLAGLMTDFADLHDADDDSVVPVKMAQASRRWKTKVKPPGDHTPVGPSDGGSRSDDHQGGGGWIRWLMMMTQRHSYRAVHTAPARGVTTSSTGWCGRSDAGGDGSSDDDRIGWRLGQRRRGRG
jgi:hypothetical protein